MKKLIRKWLGIDAIDSRVSDLENNTSFLKQIRPVGNLAPVEKPTSGPLKSMTPAEKLQDDNKEIKDRISELLS